MRQLTPRLACSLLLSALSPVALSGCGGSAASADAPPAISSIGAAFTGRAMAGKLPLIGAAVQLYAAGSSGDGSSGVALLSSALTTDSNGAFAVPAGYVCPLAASQLYLVSRGGRPGPTAASANGAATLLTALGPCNRIAASSTVVVNEVTTAAAAYALSQFLAPAANLGGSATNTAGLANAFATAAALADTTQGSSPGPTFPSNGSSPAAKIDSVANLLDSCVAGSSACSALFSASTPPGSPVPDNTLDAALNLVRNPAANVAGFYAQSTGSSAFAPVLTASPADWTLFVTFTGGGMSSPSALALDSGGNLWVASYNNVASRFSPLGQPIFPQGISGNGLSASYGLAIDQNGDAWIANQPSVGLPGNSVSVFNASGQSIAGSSGFTSGGLDFPIAVAIDTDGSAWVADNGDSHLTHLSSSGLPLTGSGGITSPLLAFPDALAIDASHNIWVANRTPPVSSPPVVTKVSPDGSQFTSYPVGDAPSALAFDQHGNLWVANYYGDSISELSGSGADLSNGGFTGGGIDHPQGIAVDGSGNVWIANFRAALLTELAGANSPSPGALLSPATGLGTDAHLQEAYAIAIDASGNLWISNAGNNTLTEFIGLAAPVRTPLIGLPTAP